MDCICCLCCYATALTVGNVCRAVKPLERMVMGRCGLARHLRVPKLRCDEIAMNHHNPTDQLREVVLYYLTRCPSPSWRGVIWAAEKMGAEANHVANGMRKSAEPMGGMQYRKYRECKAWLVVVMHNLAT